MSSAAAMFDQLPLLQLTHRQAITPFHSCGRLNGRDAVAEGGGVGGGGAALLFAADGQRSTGGQQQQQHSCDEMEGTHGEAQRRAAVDPFDFEWAELWQRQPAAASRSPPIAAPFAHPLLDLSHYHECIASQPEQRQRDHSTPVEPSVSLLIDSNDRRTFFFGRADLFSLSAAPFIYHCLQQHRADWRKEVEKTAEAASWRP